MRPSIIPLFLDVSKYIVTGVISDTLPKPFLYHQKADGARCVLFEFLLCLLADSDESESRFHHVNVLFSKSPLRGKRSPASAGLPDGIPTVVLGRVELPTSTLSVWRSNQLS